jgi:antitoxin CcdA
MHDDPKPEKQAVSLMIDAELLDSARRLEIDIAAALETRLAMLVKVEEERRWLEGNRKAVDGYNQRVAEEGLLADEAGPL